MSETTSNVSTRIFAATPITAEVRMHLNYSIEWKHASLNTSASALRFQEVRVNGCDYIGCYIEHKIYHINELNELQQNIRNQLKAFCPKLDTEMLNICIIPQVFVA